MTFDLTEARRLHDRADHDPSSCRTCPDTWPCATAIALGATGRSEWTGVPPTREPIATAPQCSAENPNYPEATNPDGTHRYPCILNQGHAPIAEPLQRTHIDRDGDTW